MRRLVGLSIFTLQRRFGDREALRLAKQIGCDAVDFNLEHEEPDKPESLYSQGEEAVRAYYSEIGAYAKEIGLLISQTHGRCSSYVNDPARDAVTLEKTRLDCIATAALGAPALVVHTLGTHSFGVDADPEFMHDFAFKMWMDMLPHAKANGIKIATETFGDSVPDKCCDFFGRQAHFLRSLKRVKESEYGAYFTACADTGHSNKATRFGEPKPADVIRQVGSEFTILHLNDNDTFTDQHKMPLSGSIDWKDVLDALDEIGYQGVYNMELVLDRYGEELALEHAAFAVKVMKNMLKERYGE